MQVERRLDLARLKADGLEIYHHGLVPALGNIEIETPTFCGSQVRLDTELRIGAFCNLNGSTVIGHTTIGRYSSIAAGCYVGGDRHPTDWLSSSRLFYVNSFRGFQRHFPETQMKVLACPSTGPQVRIGHDVLVASNCVVNRGSTIGTGAIIAAGSVVVKDIPAYAIAGGNPAKVIRMRFPEPIVERLLTSQWWDYNVFDLPALQFDQIERFLDDFEALRDQLTPYKPLTLTRNNLPGYFVQPTPKD